MPQGRATGEGSHGRSGPAHAFARTRSGLGARRHRGAGRAGGRQAARPWRTRDGPRWAPADKHGFGTAHQLESKAWFTLRQGSLSEIYYPNLSTPAFRGLQFAVSDGKGLLQRETVDDDPRHIEPLAAGVTSRVESVAGSLEFRQVTEGTGWRLTKTWITDPARATVLVQVRFESLTGRPLRLYVLADPAPGDDGNDDRGISPDMQLVAYDDVGGERGRGDAGVRGDDERLPRQLQRSLEGPAGRAPQQLRRDRSPGTSCRAPAPLSNGKRGNQTMTLAIGFGANASAARAAAAGSLARGFAAAETSFKAGWLRVPRHARATRPRAWSTGELRRVYEQSLLVLAASEDKTYRGASIAVAEHGMDLGHAHARARAQQHSGPYHLVWPRDLYHVATAQKAAGDDAAAERLLDYLWDVQKDDGSWWQNTFVWGDGEVDGRADGPGVAPDRARLVAGPHERGGLVARRAGRGLRGRERPGGATTSAGRTRAATPPTRSRRRSPG